MEGAEGIDVVAEVVARTPPSPASVVRDGLPKACSTRSQDCCNAKLLALGFLAYGLFCLATFSRRRFEAPG